MFSKEVIKLTPKVNEVLKKMGWKWKPEEGEWCVYKKNQWLIVNPKSKNIGEIWLNDPEMSYGFLAKKKKLIPILYWEKILTVLTGMGYVFKIGNSLTIAYGCCLWKNGVVVVDITSWHSWQMVVMQAVVKMGGDKK